MKTGVAIGEGEEYYAVLFEEGEGFRREEYSVGAWEGPPAGAYCHFKTRIPLTVKKKRVLVDDDVLVTFFERLKDDTEPVRLQFRFVLALILMRKRILRYEETQRDGDKEYWIMRLGKEGACHSVLNPRLTDAEAERVSRQLGVILHGDMGEFDDDVAEEEGD